MAVLESGNLESAQVIGVDIYIGRDVNGANGDVMLDEHEAPGPEERHHMGSWRIMFIKNGYDSLVINVEINIATGHAGSPGG